MSDHYCCEVCGLRYADCKCLAPRSNTVLPNEEETLKEALIFLVRRCYEQGFYSPTVHPIVLKALKCIKDEI